MKTMSEFHGLAASTALKKMLAARNFNICDLDAIAKTLSREQFLSGQDYAALRSLHCVEWAEMSPELKRMVKEKCLEMLGLPPQTVEMAQEAKAEREVSSPAPKLAFWKRG